MIKKNMGSDFLCFIFLYWYGIYAWVVEILHVLKYTETTQKHIWLSVYNVRTVIS